MKPKLSIRASFVVLVMLGLAAAIAQVPDWTAPLPCKRIGDRMIC